MNCISHGKSEHLIIFPKSTNRTLYTVTRCYFVTEMEFTDKTKSTEVQYEPLLAVGYPLQSRFFHNCVELRFRDHVVFELDVKRSFRLAVHHQENVI